MNYNERYEQERLAYYAGRFFRCIEGQELPCSTTRLTPELTLYTLFLFKQEMEKEGISYDTDKEQLVQEHTDKTLAELFTTLYKVYIHERNKARSSGVPRADTEATGA